MICQINILMIKETPAKAPRIGPAIQAFDNDSSWDFTVAAVGRLFVCAGSVVVVVTVELGLEIGLFEIKL